MTLRWRAFEKTARRRIRVEVLQSELLRKEYKLARKANWRHYQLRPWFMRIIGLCAFLLFVSFQVTPLDYIIALIFLWTLGTSFYRAAQLDAVLYYSPNLIVFDLLPISNDDIFTVQWRQFLRLSLWSALDFGVAYAVLLLHTTGGIVNAIAAGIMLALIQWLFIVATVVCLSAFAPRKYFFILSWLLQVSAFILFFSGRTHPHLCQLLGNLSCWLPPLGLILQALGMAGSRGLFHAVLLGLMAVGVLALAPTACQRVRRKFLLSERRPAGDDRSQALQEFGEQFMQTPEEAQTAIQGRQFLAGFDWPNAGFVERCVARLLSSRERVIAEFMIAANPRWTPHLRRFLIIVLIALVLGWVFASGLISGGGPTTFFAIYFLFFSFAGLWRGFASPQGGGLQSPIYAVYPIGFWEMVRSVLKINLARWIIFVLVLLGALAILSQNPQISGTSFIWIVIKILVVGFMIQPILAFAPISPGTNDTQKMRHAVPAAMLILALVGSTITFFLAWNLWVVAISGLVSMLLSILALVLYGHWFNQGAFDLIPMAKTESIAPNPNP